MDAEARTLSLLLVEDNPRDAELLICELEEAGYALKWTRVETETAYLAALDSAPDLILSDFAMPHFDGLRALALLRSRNLDIPFIVVSGTIGEERAVQAIRQGASDYLLKDRLGRLSAAVAVALEQVRLRAEQQRAQVKLRETEQRLRAFTDHSPALIFIKDLAGRYLYVNRRFEQVFGLAASGTLGKTDAELFAPALAAQYAANDRSVVEAGKSAEFEEVADCVDGRHINIVVKFPLSGAHGSVAGIGGIVTDITARKRDEELYRATFDQSAAGIIHTSPGGQFIRVNKAFCDLLGYSGDELLALSFQEVTHPDDLRATEDVRKALLADRREAKSSVWEKRYLRKDGSVIWVAISASLVRTAPGSEPDYFVAIATDITARKKLEQDLGAREAQMRKVLDTLPVGVWVLDRSGNFVTDNPAAEALWHGKRDRGTEGYGQYKGWWVGSGKRLEPHEWPGARAVQCGTTSINEVIDIECLNGARKTILESAAPIVDASGAIQGAVIVKQDITAQREQEKRIARLTRTQAMLSGINALIVRVRDRDELFREACRIAIEAGGFRMSLIAVVERGSGSIVPVASAGKDAELEAAIRSVLSSHEDAPKTMIAQAIREKRAVISNDSQNDTRLMFFSKYADAGVRSLVVLPLLVADEARGVLALYFDERDFFDEDEMALLTELAGDIAFAIDHIDKREQLDHLAYYDVLTGLANRRLFHERLEQQLLAAARDQRKVALILLDIERFRGINDSLGRHAGDALLKQLAERMTEHARDVTWLARIGADQFAILVPSVDSEDELRRRNDLRLQQVFGAPFRVADTELRISARMGIALFPNDAADADTLFRNAEAALKKAKQRGERFLYFEQRMTERVAENLALENQLRRAIDREEFVLHYQPKVDSKTRHIVGVEALIRWQSPELGLVPPGKFIPLLEDTGLILPVGAWALQRAALDHRDWCERGLNPPRVAVNVSSVQLHQRDFVGVVERAIGEGVSPAGIDLEITESMVMTDIESNIAKLEAVRALGLEIAIDDFGTGYSSLAYLAKLPVNTLKIDRSFIITMLKDPDTMTLVSTMISLAHSLRLKVVAEGVDDEEQAKILRLLRCDVMQGFLYSRPLPVEQLTQMLQARSEDQLPGNNRSGLSRRESTVMKAVA